MPSIPLSSTPINSSAIAGVLERYADQPASRLVADFESSLAAYLGSVHVLAVNSGTAAIHLGLRALGVKPGDVVLAPTSTYVATIFPILYLGAEPVFIDNEPTTWSMDPNLLETAIAVLRKEKKRIGCAIVVDNYGAPACLNEIRQICSRFEVPLLEDAAAALGASYQGEKAATLGDISVVSFNNNKTITTYGGGALITKNRELHRKAAFWASQAREDRPFYQHSELGYNYGMSAMSAAVGLANVPYIEEKVARRRQVFELYRTSLKKIEGLEWQAELENTRSSRWLSCFYHKELKNNDLATQMQAKGIECRRLWNPMHKQPAFIHCRSFLSGHAEKLFNQGLGLPSSDLAHVAPVCDALVGLL